MKRLVFALLLLMLCCSIPASAQETPIRDIYPDTWVGTDALGRTMPDSSIVGPLKNDQRRVAGMFYITWHTDALAGLKKPYGGDVTKVLNADPSARLDGKNPHWTEGSYHWGEPELGYFLSSDPYVIRHDMSMLSDAGVDVLVMDVTNAVCYWDQWKAVFSTMEQMKKEGNKVPQFCFWAFNGPVVQVVQDLYDRVYKTDQYKDLWFNWDGKPLLLYNGNPEVAASGGTKGKDYSKEVKDFFTLRTMWWGYYEWGGKRFVGTEDNWSFGYDMGDKRVSAMNTADLLSTHDGKREEAAVTPAQHPSSLVGKSWSRRYGEPLLDKHDLPRPTTVPWLGKREADPQDYGIYFQQRWDEAIAAHPQFLYMNDWNEWTAGKYPTAAGKTTPFMRRDSNYFFVDQYNAEFNRTIEPMKGGYTDNYYMQMAENLRRYKGARPIPELHGLQTMSIDGDFSDWNNISVEYRDTIGDTVHRDYNGYGGNHYKNDSGRNDIVTCKVAFDAENVYFYVETNEPLTPHTGNNWMMLLIDADKNSKTGWFGYDFLINQKIIDDKTTTLMRYDPTSRDHPWVEQAKLNYRYRGKMLELSVPRKMLNLGADAATFDFKWADNPTDLKDPISLCTSGDTAPNRRFNYRCIWTR
ncbi:MAG TPA: hypothetical protein VFE58_00035 [Tepidisphaeraceae bacterium]|jgi:hypothetical protein|nr:hypothetical protein [Tepidisphaeraceae bacterium]